MLKIFIISETIFVLQRRVNSAGVIIIILPSPFIIFKPIFPSSFRINVVAGSKLAEMSKVPVIIIDLASSSSPRYLSRSPSTVDMIGAL